MCADQIKDGIERFNCTKHKGSIDLEQVNLESTELEQANVESNEKLDISLESVLPANNANEAGKNDVSLGVREMEHVLVGLNKRWTALLYIEIFLLGYALSMDRQLRSAFQAQALDYLRIHSSMATVDSVKQIVSACASPLLAHLANNCGRITVLCIGIFLYVIGTVFVALAGNLGMFAFGISSNYIGSNTLFFMIDLLCADLSLLNWRLLASVAPLTPYIINTWIAGFVVEAYMWHDSGHRIRRPEGWRWAFGQWGIIMAVVSLALVVSLYHRIHLTTDRSGIKRFGVKKADFLNRTRSAAPSNSDFSTVPGKGVSVGDFTKKNNSNNGISGEYLAVEGISRSLSAIADSLYRYDAIGLLLLCATLFLILLPMSLAAGDRAQWRSAKTLTPIAVGGAVILPLFAIWELRTKWSLLPRNIARNRGVWAPLICISLGLLCFELRRGFLYTLLQVGMNVSAKRSTMFANLYQFCGTITAFLVGILVVKLRRLKPFVMIGFTLWFVSFGIMHVYRVKLNSVSGIAASEVLRGVGNGFVILVTKIIIQAEAPHQYTALLIAANKLSYHIGLAVGGAILSVIWGSILPHSLYKYMDDRADADSVFHGPLTFIGQKAPWGSQKRNQIVHAYSDTQKVLNTIALCLMSLMFVLGFFYRNRRLAKNVQQDDKDLIEDIDRSTTPPPKRWLLQMKDMILETFHFG